MPMTPVKVGTTIAGTFPDGSGNPAQNHLVYAENAGVWWLFSLTSASDTAGNPGTHVVKCWVSSGADLSVATWTAKTDTPNIDGTVSSVSGRLHNGRSLGVCYLNHSAGGVGSKDIVHVSASIYPDSVPDSGQAVNGHIRAKLTATTITWGVWGYYLTGSFNYPTGTPLRAGNCVGTTPDGFVQAAASTYHQELDASVTTSTAADTGDTWDSGGRGTGALSVGSNLITSMSSQAALTVGMGISYESGDTTPGIVKVNSIDSSTQVTMSGTANNAQASTGAVAWNSMTPGALRTNMVLDNTMTNQCDCYAFASLAGSKMLVVYDNGGTVPVVSPNLTNLRYTKGSAAQSDGLWPSTVTGDGDVFGAANTQDDNDWCLVGVTVSSIYCTRRSAATTLEVNVYNVLANTWSALASQPPALTGKTIKAGAGVMGITDGIDMWLFVIDSVDNAIKYCKYSVGGASWDAGWTSVATVDSTAKYLSGSLKIGNGRAGLVYSVTNGANFDTYVAQLFPLNPRRFLMGKH